MSLLQLQDLSRVYRGAEGRVVALHGVNLQVQRGETLSIIGPSGCGKSSLLRLIAGIDQPDAGRIEFPDGRPRIGVVFQETRLLPWLSVAENIAMPLRLTGMSAPQRRARVQDLVEQVGLSGFHDYWPDQLSGGMAQRAALARALAQEPELLLLDEPFGALDSITRDHMVQEVASICRCAGTTVILVTHSLSEAVWMGDRIGVMAPRPGHIIRLMPVPDSDRRTLGSVATPAMRALADDLRSFLGLIHV
jgi:ABC-type nitrate/sulfonate/bicarbonate transport system ATPase subunit